MRKQARENIYKKYLIKQLPKLCKEFLKLNKKKTNNPILKMGKRPEQTLHQRRYPRQ